MDNAQINFAAKAAQQAADKQAAALAPDCDPVPSGLPISPAWRALGTQIAISTGYRMFRGDKLCPDQWEMQSKRLAGQRLPKDVECRKIERQARYLLVQGNAVIAESDLRAAGYPDAFAGSPTWVLLEFVTQSTQASQPAAVKES